jgi:hypothetical protein
MYFRHVMSELGLSRVAVLLLFPFIFLFLLLPVRLATAVTLLLSKRDAPRRRLGPVSDMEAPIEERMGRWQSLRDVVRTLGETGQGEPAGTWCAADGYCRVSPPPKNKTSPLCAGAECVAFFLGES